MSDVIRLRLARVLPIVAAIALCVAAVYAQEPTNNLPNPFEATDHWGTLPAGRTWGSTAGVDIDSKGHIWVAERCGANSCLGSTLDPILEFDASGKLLKSFGAGMFVFPHGVYVDRNDNVWITDGQDNQPRPARGAPPNAPLPPPPAKPMGQQVFKFSPDGKVLLVLGKAGVSGEGPDTFNAPSDVITNATGDIFVADGHGGNTNARIVKFDKNGKFIKTWGKHGSGPGEFDVPHALAFDSRGRLFVGDRANNRIQIFDQDGSVLADWKQFSRPSGIFIDKQDTIYVVDSESNKRNHPGGWKRGMRIGSAKDGSVKYFIPDPGPDPDETNAGTSAAEGVAAADNGRTIYGAEVGPKQMRRYVRRTGTK